MDQTAGAGADEMAKTVASVAVEFYAQATPAALAGRLARLHQTAWEDVLAGRNAVASFAELQRHAQRLFNPDDLINKCNAHILWALTPVIAAQIACGEGEEPINLREIGAALTQLLRSALVQPERRVAA